MNAPDDTVIAFPAANRRTLHWQALGLANAARLAAETLSFCQDLAARLAACGTDGRALADRAMVAVPGHHINEQAMRCRMLGRRLSDL